MGYYIRVLGTQDIDIHLDELLNDLQTDGLVAKIAFAEGENPSKWSLLEVSNRDNEVLTQIERNSVFDNDLGKQEPDEFREEVTNYKPMSAANWLIDFFNKVKVIYVFQLFNAAFEDDNFEIVTSIKTTIWNQVSGILQADNEGFSNEDGYHILWQFSNNVKGDWSCAVIDSEGQWQNFLMDLGNKKQRNVFLDGNVPKGAKLLWEEHSDF